MNQNKDLDNSIQDKIEIVQLSENDNDSSDESSNESDFDKENQFSVYPLLHQRFPITHEF